MFSRKGNRYLPHSQWERQLQLIVNWSWSPESHCLCVSLKVMELIPGTWFAWHPHSCGYSVSCWCRSNPSVVQVAGKVMGLEGLKYGESQGGKQRWSCSSRARCGTQNGDMPRAWGNDWRMKLKRQVGRTQALGTEREDSPWEQATIVKQNPESM